MTQAERVKAVECLVDASSVFEVSSALELVCYEKAEHLRSNWQDAASARDWERAAKAIQALNRKLQRMKVA